MPDSHDYGGSSCYFKAGTVNPLTKATSTIENAIAHNRRTTQAAHGARSNIDPKRSHLNYCLAGDKSPNAITQRVRAAMIEHRARKNAPHAVEVLISLPANWQGDARAVFTDAIPYLEGVLGADNLLSADVHLDEANPHMHVLFMPLEHCKKKGRLVWRSTLQGRTQRLYDGFFKQVGGEYGIDKPIQLDAKTKKALAENLIDMMRRSSDGAANSMAWEPIKRAVRKSPIPFAVACGIDLTAFNRGKNPLVSFEGEEKAVISKLPTCVREFQSIDLETGELKAMEGAENNFGVNVKSMIEVTRAAWLTVPCEHPKVRFKPPQLKNNQNQSSWA